MVVKEEIDRGKRKERRRGKRDLEKSAQGVKVLDAKESEGNVLKGSIGL